MLKANNNFCKKYSFLPYAPNVFLLIGREKLEKNVF